MKLPNGYGSIVKLTGKRRRPWMVRKSIDPDDDGKPKMKVLGYYATRAEALDALAKFNACPLDLNLSRLTFEQVFNAWYKVRFGENGPAPKDKSASTNYRGAYKWCAPLHQLPFSELKTEHFQKVVDDCERGYTLKETMKTLLNQMTKYALSKDIVNKNYATLIKLPSKVQSTMHKPFTPEEIEQLWQRSLEVNVQLVLILIYTGMRPSELLKIKREDVYLAEHYMIGGIKTATSKRRAIPIADKILPFVTDMMSRNTDSEFLYPAGNGKELDYSNFRKHVWIPLMEDLKMQHLPHDGRHTCATLLDDLEPPINQLVIKKILGHAGKDITEKVYTHKAITRLVEAINRI